jgi:hypothetical protein
MSYTKYPNRPNERFVKLEYRIKFHIYNIMWCALGEAYEVIREQFPNFGCTTYGVERDISQTIDLQLFCDKWQTGHGTLKLLTHADPAYLADDQSIFEDVVNIFTAGYLTNYIDGQVRQKMKNMEAGFLSSTDLPFECDALGYFDDPITNNGNQINWSYHPPSMHTTSTINDRISVKLVSVKRLVAHDEHNEPLYDVVEVPDVQLYANYNQIYISLPPMQEGDEVTVVNAPTMVVPRTPNLESLVVIANVLPQGLNPPFREHSAYRVFSSSANFGSGMQSIIVYKSYTLTPRDPGSVDSTPLDDDDIGVGGPIIAKGNAGVDTGEFLVAGYELVFEVMLLDNKFE